MIVPELPEGESLLGPEGNSDCGYCCQMRLALETVRDVFDVEVPHVWFSICLNAVRNVRSSNPVQVYLDLSDVVQTGDVGSKIIRGYKITLKDIMLRSKIDDSKSTLLQDRIDRATIDNFQPQIWRLDLKAIARRKNINVNELLLQCRGNAAQLVNKNLGQTLQPDEYLIYDLQKGEYTVIVDR